MSGLTVVITVISLVLIVMLLRYWFYDPYTLQTIQSGKVESVISNSALATDGVNKAPTNFAYSFWFYVDNWNYNYGREKILFRRAGNNPAMASTAANTTPGPKVAFAGSNNDVNVTLACLNGASGTASVIEETCSISNVPLQKWVHLVVSVYGRSMDLYLDGKLVRTCLLPGIASTKDSDVVVTPGGGFDGWTANLKYFPKPLNPQEVWNLYVRGYSDAANFLNWSSYQVQVAILENGNPRSKLTL